MGETVEALIGATFRIHGLEKCESIVYPFIKFAIERQNELREQGEFDRSQNYKGKLLELLQDPHFATPDLNLKITDLKISKKIGQDGVETFHFEDDVTFNGEKHKISTQYWSDKKTVEQEVSYLILCIITGTNPKYSKYDLAISTPPLQEKTVLPTESIDSEGLIFRKLDLNGPIDVSSDTGEMLVDWIERKAQKDYFRMLFLLSARLDNVSVSSLNCKVSSDVLAIIYLQLGEQKYFSFGRGTSSTKALKFAGEYMRNEVDLVKWVDKNYPNYEI